MLFNVATSDGFIALLAAASFWAIVAIALSTRDKEIGR
jgi:hypothetical protein